MLIVGGPLVARPTESRTFDADCRRATCGPTASENSQYSFRYSPAIGSRCKHDDSRMNVNPDRRGHAALRRGRMSMSHCCYLVTTVTLHRTPWLADPRVADAVASLHRDSTLFGDAEIRAWVLMPDHWHGIVRLGQTVSLQRFMNRFKSRTARAGNAALGRVGAFWAQAFHDRAIRNERELALATEYVARNPVRAGLCDQPSEYRWLWVHDV